MKLALRWQLYKTILTFLTGLVLKFCRTVQIAYKSSFYLQKPVYFLKLDEMFDTFWTSWNVL